MKPQTTAEHIATRGPAWAAPVWCKDAVWHHLMDACPPCGYEHGTFGVIPEPGRGVLTHGGVS